MSKKRSRSSHPVVMKAKPSDTVFHQSGVEATRQQMPKYNAFAVGHGSHGDRKYNRNKKKAEDRRRINHE